MKIFPLIFSFMLISCVCVYASDMALYAGEPNIDGWYSAAAVLEDVETIIGKTSALFDDVQQFGDDRLAEFAAWAEARIDDDKLDIIWLNGCVPSTLYPFPNLEPDGSVAERWLDGGNMIINVGDWFAYCSYEGGARKADNGSSGAANILDLASAIIYSADNTAMIVTADGKKYLPSIGNSCITYRPIAVNQVLAPWEVAAIFAESGNGADPIVIHNTETDGYVAFINQAAGAGPPGWLDDTGPPGWLDDRGETTAEFITNWVGEVICLKSIAVEPTSKLTDTWGAVKHLR